MQASKARKKIRPGVIHRGSPHVLLTVAAPTPFICGPSRGFNCKPPPPTPPTTTPPTTKCPPHKSSTNHMHTTSPVRVIAMKQVRPKSEHSDSRNHQTANYKPKTQFTPQQLHYLDERFLEGHFPSAIAKENMAKELELTRYHIQIWFQNRRAKFRRQVRRSMAKETMKHTPIPPSYWPQHLPFDSNFAGILNASKDSQRTGTPSPSVSEPSKVKSEPFSSPETPQLGNGLLQESLTPESPLSTGESTISGTNTSPLSSPAADTVACSSTMTNSSQSLTVSISIQHHSSNMESSCSNPQSTSSADTSPTSITPTSVSPMTVHPLPSFNDKFPCNSNHMPYSNDVSVPPPATATTTLSSATVGYERTPLGPATLPTTTDCSVNGYSMSLESTTVSTPTLCSIGSVSSSSASCCTADKPPRPAAMQPHCNIEYVTPNPMTHCSVDHVHPVPTVKTAYCSIDHVPPVGYAPPKPTTMSPPVVNAAPATGAGAFDSAPWMESISSTALSLMSKARAAAHTDEPVNHNPLPLSRLVTTPGAPAVDRLPLSRPVTHPGASTTGHLRPPVSHPGAPTTDHLPPPVTHPSAPTASQLPLSRLVTHPSAPTASHLPPPVTHPGARTAGHLPPPVAHPGAPTANHPALPRPVTHAGAPTANHPALPRPVTHAGAPTANHPALPRPVTHAGAPIADHLPPPVTHPGARTAGHLPPPVAHPGAPTASHPALPRPVTHAGAPIADHLPLSRPVTHPSAPTADHLPLPRPVTHPGAPTAGTVTPSLMNYSCNSATYPSRQGSVISGALEKANGLTFTYNTAENHTSPPAPSLIHAEPPMQLANILGEDWDLGEWDLLQPILTAEYQQTYAEPEPPVPTPPGNPYFHMHQQNSYHGPTPLSSNDVPVGRPMLVQNPTPFTPQWHNAIPNVLQQFRPIPPARSYDKLSATRYHFNYSGPLQSSREGYNNSLPLHSSRVPFMFGAGTSTNGPPYTLSSS